MADVFRANWIAAVGQCGAVRNAMFNKGHVARFAGMMPGKLRGLGAALTHHKDTMETKSRPIDRFL